eukprot:COSAG01_NODE_7091_length_3358_cov_5.097269_3_plen_121_part_00
MDLSKQACAAGWVPRALTTADGAGLTPFAKGAICANLAWLTVWPADVIKTQRQSGNYRSGPASTSVLTLFKQNLASGNMYRGVLPGLVRSTIANGCSMVVYEMVHTELSNYYGVSRTDIT